jgi:hypothetical protein
MECSIFIKKLNNVWFRQKHESLSLLWTHLHPSETDEYLDIGKLWAMRKFKDASNSFLTLFLYSWGISALITILFLGNYWF